MTANASVKHAKITPQQPAQAGTNSKDAITLLHADREAVSRLFSRYETSQSGATKKALVTEICTALRVHAQIKEEIFYPEVKDALQHKMRVPQALVEHAGVRLLIARLQGVEPDGERYDSSVKVLSEYVQRHITSEHNEMFIKTKVASLDLVEVGARMAARKDDLLARAA